MMKTSSFFKSASFTALLIAGLALSACETISSKGYTQGKDGLTEITYPAVDALITQATEKNVISKQTPLLVGTFVDLNDVDTTQALGRSISEQFTTRLVQLGLNVADVKLRDKMNINQSGEHVLSRDPDNLSKTFNVAGVISGTYTIGEENVLFNARMTSAVDGKLIAAQDFIIPKTADVHKLARPDSKRSGLTEWYKTGAE